MIKLKIAFDRIEDSPINMEWYEHSPECIDIYLHFKEYLELIGIEKVIPVIFGYFGNTKDQDEEMYDVDEIFEYIEKDESMDATFIKGILRFDNIKIPAMAYQDASPIGIYFNEKYLPLLKDYYDKIEFDNSKE